MMKATQEDYDRLLKQATSMMVALRDIAGVMWKTEDTLCDVIMYSKDPLEAIREAREAIMGGLSAMEDVLKTDALEKPLACGHERRFTIHREGEASLCALCDLEKARKERP